MIQNTKSRSVVGIIDLGISNIGKILNVLKNQNTNIKIIKSYKDFKNIDKLIFPGLGLFGKASQELRAKNLTKLIKDYCLNKKKPYFGICLGMQILCKTSEESPNEKGLLLLNDVCKKLKFNKKLNITVPHIGFKSIKERKKIKKDADKFYFTHSYYLEYLHKKKYMKSYVQYGDNKICSLIIKDNIHATQFHPELSGIKGIKILNNFLNL